ncbi:hypothetical protein CO670_17095 [Rhizobium sp. J15]|nr:hypothetical protein CO670_17095 [Rhizobium sp. J15]
MQGAVNLIQIVGILGADDLHSASGPLFNHHIIPLWRDAYYLKKAYLVEFAKDITVPTVKVNGRCDF